MLKPKETNPMPHRKTKRAESRAEKPEDKRQRLDKALEEGLEETFPASDAVAVIEPASTPPGNDRDRHKPKSG